MSKPVKYTKYQQVYQKRQTEQQLLAARKEIARKDVQLSIASDAVRVEMRKREAAERRLKTEGGAVVVMAYPGVGPLGDQWVSSMTFRPEDVFDRHIRRSYLPVEPRNMRHIAHEICRKAENELTELLTDIFTGKKS